MFVKNRKNLESNIIIKWEVLSRYLFQIIGSKPTLEKHLGVRIIIYSVEEEERSMTQRELLLLRLLLLLPLLTSPFHKNYRPSVCGSDQMGSPVLYFWVIIYLIERWGTKVAYPAMNRNGSSDMIQIEKVRPPPSDYCASIISSLQLENHIFLEKSLAFQTI